ncbi:hypothetical protein RHGRI_029367 [Rhododendron griersonianum]|uniref:Transposase-associated domain-containing protein n=1 Tax=Rhododendron griersonianum TaxID=479676 RepID=A0AAV6IMU1_9ERIC|nr:hypothetical protein RHGRI_029367 [Rhododendron griersonianum]
MDLVLVGLNLGELREVLFEGRIELGVLRFKLGEFGGERDVLLLEEGARLLRCDSSRIHLNGSLCWLESLPGFFKLTPMDKSWIDIRNRLDPTYIQGVEKFLDFAYDKKHPDSKIYCPCKKCVNLIFGTRSGVKEHLIINGFNTNYTRWTIHGESLASSSRNESDANQSSYFQDDMIGMVHDAFGVPRQDGEIRDNAGLGSMGLGLDKETKKFFKLLEDAQREFYPNCKTFTALSFTTHLLHIKVLGGWTDTSFDMLVELLRKAFPVRETLPKSFAEEKKFNEALGFSYEKIDACPKDCMLFWKDKKGLRNCEKCGTSRYKESTVFLDDGTAKLTQIPAKQVDRT